MGLLSFAGAVGWAFMPEHKELVITSAVAVVAAIAAKTSGNPVAEY